MSKGNELARTNFGLPVDQAAEVLTVGELERRLLARFPAEHAEEWDRTGMLVGNGASVVDKVAVALDPTVAAIRLSAQAGAHVLLTHHPVFLDAPDSFHPFREGIAASGSCVYEAVKADVSILSFHTALDVSPAAAAVLPSLLCLVFKRVLLASPVGERLGYGQVCGIRSGDEPLTLSQLAARCLSVTGRMPRVWGDPSKKLETVCTATGSASNLIDLCLASGLDCLVCGELRYHDALPASLAGLCIVELGHDTSELPLCTVLAEEAVAAGVSRDKVVMLDQNANWWTPEATRR